MSIYENEEWNLTLVRESVNFIAIVDQAIDRLESVESLPEYEKIDMFSRTATAMNRVKSFLDDKIFKQAETAAPDAGQADAVDPSTRPEDLSQFFDFFDDPLMGDFVEPMDTLDYQSHHIN